MSSLRVVSSILAGLVLTTPCTSAAVIDAYTDDQRETRQTPWIEAVRGKLDLDIDFSMTNSVYVQIRALMAQLEFERRGGTPKLDEVELEVYFRAMLTRNREIIQPENSCDEPNPVPYCTTNVVIPWFSAFQTAYTLKKYSDAIDWDSTTLDAARSLYTDENWPVEVDNLSNSSIPRVGMRLLGGEAVGDVNLLRQGVMDLLRGRDEDVRKGLTEPMAGHYMGVALTMLTLLVDGIDEFDSQELQDAGAIAESFLELYLLVPAHHYMPGGGVGAPQDRKSGGAIADKDPRGASHLIPTLNLLINDPLINGGDPARTTIAGYPPELVVIEYMVPEVIRSIYLDKGDGYTFWHRGVVPENKNHGGGYSGQRGYPIGLVGTTGNDPTETLTNPNQLVMLPGGSGSMGVRYGSGRDFNTSSGLYLRDPVGAGQESDADFGFSILYHHQPSHFDPDPDDLSPSWDPLADDPLWHYEEHAPYRRMMHGRTAITLFDATYEAVAGEATDLDYTMVHLPDFSDPDVGDAARSCWGWRVGQTGDTLVAFYPIYETIDEQAFTMQQHPPKAGEEQGGAWTYLELDSANNVTGNVTEIRPLADFTGAQAEIDAYCDELGGRTPTVDLVSKTASVALTEPDTGLQVTMALDWEYDKRTLDYGGGAAEQYDQPFLDRGLVRSEWIGETAPIVSFNDAELSLSVVRAPYTSVQHDFGDLDIPTGPGHVRIKPEGSGATQTVIRWDLSWDDSEIVKYDVYEGEAENFLGSTFSNNFTLPRCALPPGEQSTLYVVKAVDDIGNVSESEGRILIGNDVTPPSIPEPAALGHVNGIDLSWDASIDDCAVFIYQVFRDGGALTQAGPGGPFVLLANNLQQTNFTDIPPNPLLYYKYYVRVADIHANWSANSEVAVGRMVDDVIPLGPTSINGFALGEDVVVLWSGATDNYGVLGYLVHHGIEVNFTQNTYFIDQAAGVGDHTYRVEVVDFWNNRSAEPYPEVTVTVTAP